MGGFIKPPATGGGGGGQQIFDVVMDTPDGFAGMLSLSAESSYNVGDILIITSSELPGGGFIFPDGSDTIGGEMNYPLGASETLLLQTTGTGDFYVLASGPKLYAVEFATGGDTFNLPDLDTVPAGFTQQVTFNSGSGSVTVEPMGGQTITGGDQTISTLYASMTFVNTGYGSWEPYRQGPSLALAAGWSNLPTAGAEGDRAYLQDAEIFLRWSEDVDPLDGDGRRWVPDAIYSSSTGTGVVAGVVEWLEGVDCASVGDGNPVSTWPNRAGTGDYTSASTNRPLYDADGGVDGGGAVAFDGSNDYMSKSSGLGTARNKSSLAMLALVMPDGFEDTYTWWYASLQSNAGQFRVGLYGTADTPQIYVRAADNVSVSPIGLYALTEGAWGLLSGRGDLSLGLSGGVAQGPWDQDTQAATTGGTTANTDSAAIWVGAYSSGGTPTDPVTGRIGTIVVLADLDPGAARAVAAWLSSRAALL